MRFARAARPVGWAKELRPAGPSIKTRRRLRPMNTAAPEFAVNLLVRFPLRKRVRRVAVEDLGAFHTRFG